MSGTSTTRLAELIGNRRRCLEQLLALGQRQAELIAAGNMTDLLRLLAAKQQLIVALEALEVELAPYHDEDPEARAWPSQAVRARCAADAQRCKELIADVLELEQSGERQLTIRRDAAATQLRAATAAGRAREAYEQCR